MEKAHRVPSVGTQDRHNKTQGIRSFFQNRLSEYSHKEYRKMFKGHSDLLSLSFLLGLVAGTWHLHKDRFSFLLPNLFEREVIERKGEIERHGNLSSPDLFPK